MKRKAILYWLISSFWFFSKPVASAAPQEVQTGIYLMNIYDLDINAYSFYADFYLWFKWKGELDPMNIEFVNSVEKWGYTIEPYTEEPVLMDDGYFYNGMRIEGRFYHSFELGRFPLDQHELDIRVENVEYSNEALLFVPMESTSLIRPDFKMPGWNIVSSRMDTHANFYETDFGEGKKRAYSNFTFGITIARPLSYFLLKLLLPLMVVILASLGTLFLDPSFTDTRISLPIGGLLTSVFLQQSYSSALPDVGYMVLMDKIYLLSYILISLIILKVILSGNRLIQRKTDPFSQKIKALDQRLALLFTAIYLSGILALVLIT